MRFSWLSGEEVEGRGLKGLEEKVNLIGGVVDGAEDDIWWERGRRGHSSGDVIIFPRHYYLISKHAKEKTEIEDKI